MTAFIRSLLVAAACSPSSRTRLYYVAADEVEWDYAPAGKDLITGQPFDSAAREFTIGDLSLTAMV